MKDLEIVEPSRTEIIPAKDDTPSGLNKLAGAAADNIGEVLKIANNMVEIKKMQVQSDQVLAAYDKEIKKIEVEAEAYVKKHHEDTDGSIRKIDKLRQLMNDYYENPNTSLTGDQLANILAAVLNGQTNKE